MRQKFTLLNCEGDFLLVEKNGEDWFFKLLIQIESVKGTKSIYQLTKTSFKFISHCIPFIYD